MDQRFIRNFSIIAHIDHGKSTLADRILELTGALQQREMRAQYLDKMDIERERGITIKAQSVRLHYVYDGEEYQLNLIDTPGHVDFHYEVSKSLGACEGALLVVDATQGVEAQTLANVYLALDQNLEIVPVLNKIDLPSSDPESVAEEIEDIIGIAAADAPRISAKEGVGIADVLEQIILKVPPPKGNPDGPLRALIFDSWYDTYVGTIALVRIGDGSIRRGDRIRFVNTNKVFDVDKVGVFAPEPLEVACLNAGEVGFVVAGVKSVHDIRIGDTITGADRPTDHLYDGFRDAKPMVFAGLYPTENADYDQLKDALDKLRLNDNSFTFEPETSLALGYGFRCGYLGLLHMEVIQERLEREYDLDLITTAPTVTYKVIKKDGTEVWIDNPAKMPSANDIQDILEPYIKTAIHVPEEYIGAVMKLSLDRRGEQVSMDYHSHSRVIITYRLPLAEVVFDFYDKLKSNTKGYASMDYEEDGMTAADLVKVDILLNGDPVDALSVVVHKSRSHTRGLALIQKMKEFIDRQQYDVAIQAAVGTRVIARVNVKAFRKNVTAKCYGGDISRKRKLLEKQKKGKKRMKMVGAVEIPQEAFLAVLKVDTDD
ncbi:translation elongation factor 4 [Myxococcota bacterium]|jgi:GTP-binding protein LepA|nr:translation elongation factor 4 [Myxococcota bacterium]MBU1410745.1 translation elongation factor 4 [Myxococcota bacterium]MBU1511648.1 translation elongation factor 4 [Myxococcota bacterium]PKN25449.1 MAG: elongation factor 4 [Deltaproteobacteria bacterium HGW-Deltaproteobacteria-22]